jgi:hypothetical protein
MTIFTRRGVARARTALAIATATFAASMTIGDARADPLAALRGKSRVLVVIAPSTQDQGLQRQRQSIEAASNGMFERNVVLVEAIGDGTQARQLRQRVAAGDKDFQVILVGKDGNTAFASNAPLAAQDIFGRIDAMPMRRDEMRRQSSLGG